MSNIFLSSYCFAFICCPEEDTWSKYWLNDIAATILKHIFLLFPVWCNIICHKRSNKIMVGVSVAYNFQSGCNKIKVLTEYESVTKKVVTLVESILQYLLNSFSDLFVACKVVKLYSVPLQVFSGVFECNVFHCSNNSEFNFVERCHRGSCKQCPRTPPPPRK